MIGAIAGGIAQAYYGKIPDKIIDPVKQRLPEAFLRIIDQFSSTFNCPF
jgi:ADP-ribosylglycohydrolase